MADSLDTIDASPTKELFISMLVRDITLKDAIGDLVDNSVDGARSMIPDKRYKGLKIQITVTKKEFKIEDNCGGFTTDVARKYAFKFGRPKDFPTTKGSIGQFGIGMKRAIFKLGLNINIESITKTTSFKLPIVVNTWRNENDWDLKFSEFKEKQNNPKASWGTKINITNLTKEASEQFADPTFIKGLVNEIAKENMYNIHQGLQIYINGHELKSDEIYLITNENIKPAYREIVSGKVKVRIYAGIGKDRLEDGGWYIFCNDRLVVGPEQSTVTGWTGKGKDGVAVYHDQFSRFRGYVFFESDESSALPWNTTKTSMDLDSPLFISVRQTMIDLMKPVITFLNKLKQEKEKDNPVDNQPLNQVANKSKESVLNSIKEEDVERVFTYPNLVPKKAAKNEAKISYSRPERKVKAVKEYFGTTSNKEVGEKTFDYFYDNEIA